mmetsp:Transcript_112826/g.158301  ORF Transcript_112826/g.158301 Transcript_112826/m.158301 type:complete len:84 (+) Transcript_112826:544-795(+)
MPKIVRNVGKASIAVQVTVATSMIFRQLTFSMYLCKSQLPNRDAKTPSKEHNCICKLFTPAHSIMTQKLAVVKTFARMALTKK